VILLNKLMDRDFLVKTPSQDYDDSYCIQYARKFNAFMVTNDKFRDYIDGLHQALAQETTPANKKQDKLIIDKSSIQKE
jgi:hypothetical protein